jgi:hypothetical protein
MAKLRLCMRTGSRPFDHCRRPQWIPLAWCRGVKTAASIVVRGSVRVHVFGSSGGLKNTRITEGTQRFILVQADRCPTSSS